MHVAASYAYTTMTKIYVRLFKFSHEFLVLLAATAVFPHFRDSLLLRLKRLIGHFHFRIFLLRCLQICGGGGFSTFDDSSNQNETNAQRKRIAYFGENWNSGFQFCFHSERTSFFLCKICHLWMRKQDSVAKQLRFVEILRFTSRHVIYFTMYFLPFFILSENLTCLSL